MQSSIASPLVRSRSSARGDRSRPVGRAAAFAAAVATIASVTCFAPGLAAQAHEKYALDCPWSSYSNYWGSSIAANDTWMVTGAPRDSTIWPLLGHGAISIHRRDPTTGHWVHHQSKYASDYSNDDKYGFAVAIDRDVIAVTALGNQVGSVNRAGSVYVLRYDAVTGVFVEEQRLDSIAPQTDEYFGHALGLKGDVLLVGAPQGGDGNVQVFRRDPVTGVWAFDAQLLDHDATIQEKFGHAIAFDGTTAVISAPGATDNFVSHCGTVELFDVSGTTWTQGQEITAVTRQVSGFFGNAVALDGNRVAIGCANELVGAVYYAGAVHLHVRDVATGLWSFEQRVVSPAPAYGSGFAAALDLAGELLAIGAYDEIVTGYGYVGAAHSFRLGRKKNGPWHYESRLTHGTTNSVDDFGNALAITGSELVIAARYADTASGADSGQLFIHDAAEFTLNVTPTQPAPGATIDLEAHRGAPGAPLLLAVEAIDAVPVFIPLLYDVFAADYTWNLQLDAPDPAFGSVVTVRAWKVGAGGPLVASNAVDVDL
jgi:hypothetical protein